MVDLNRNGRVGLRNQGHDFRAHEVIKRIGGVGRQAMEHVKVESEVRSELGWQHCTQAGVGIHAGHSTFQEQANAWSAGCGFRFAADAVEEEALGTQVAHVHEGTDGNDTRHRSRDGSSNQARKLGSQARAAERLARELVSFA